jgi:hypothetical protein
MLVFANQLERIRLWYTKIRYYCYKRHEDLFIVLFNVAVKWSNTILYFCVFFCLSLASRLFHLLARSLMDHCLRRVPLPVVNNTRKQCPSRRSARNINQGLATCYISHKSIRLSSLSPSLNFRMTLSKMEFQTWLSQSTTLLVQRVP